MKNTSLQDNNNRKLLKIIQHNKAEQIYNLYKELLIRTLQ